MTRTRFQNIDGIKRRFTESHEIINAMEEKELDILGVAKENTNLTYGEQNKLQLAIKVRFGQRQIIASSSKSSKEVYLLGGTAKIMRG